MGGGIAQCQSPRSHVTVGGSELWAKRTEEGRDGSRGTPHVLGQARGYLSEIQRWLGGRSRELQWGRLAGEWLHGQAGVWLHRTGRCVFHGAGRCVAPRAGLETWKELELKRLANC